MGNSQSATTANNIPPTSPQVAPPGCLLHDQWVDALLLHDIYWHLRLKLPDELAMKIMDEAGAATPFCRLAWPGTDARPGLSSVRIRSMGPLVTRNLVKTRTTLSPREVAVLRYARVATLSSDQGWVDNPGAGSWSWFTLNILDTTGGSRMLCKSHSNDAGSRIRLHKSPYIPLHDLKDFSTVAGLAVDACAQFPGWENRISEVDLRVWKRFAPLAGNARTGSLELVRTVPADLHGKSH